MTQEVLDRRETIEQAFEQAEKVDVGTQVSQPASESAAAAGASRTETTSPQVTEPAGGKVAPVAPIAEDPAATDKATVGSTDPTKTAATATDAATPGADVAVDKAPQSWRAPQKAKWAALDPDVRQEIIRRERETTKVLGESAQARQLTTAFQQAVQPYAPRLQALGANPMQAVQRLLQADAFLASAPAAQRAGYMAKLIKDYQIDIAALDSALAGTAQADPVAARVEQLLQQRLAPFQTFIQQQQAQTHAQQEQVSQQIGTTIEQMAADPKYPHFETVREDMADVIDIASKRGVYLTLEQAYSRAVAMNPEVSQEVASQQAAEATRAAALTANARAQRALNASASVGGAPNGAPSGSPINSTDRRAVIEAAFSSATGGR